MIPRFSQLEAVLPRIAQDAGIMLLQMQEEVQVIDQSYKDFVTDADLKSEEFIIRELKREFPGIPTYAEESGGSPKTEGPLWVIDPIDGTVNFAHCDDHWSVSIALAVDGKSIAGAVDIPKQEMSFYADYAMERYSSGLSKTSRLKDAHIWTDWAPDVDRTVLTLKRLRESTLLPEIRLSCTASMAALVIGKIDGYVHINPTPFDFAAMALVVEKFGGTVTELDGSPWNAFSKSIVASNGLLHDQILRIVHY